MNQKAFILQHLFLSCQRNAEYSTGKATLEGEEEKSQCLLQPFSFKRSKKIK
jgi:hypothetical protein